MQKSVRTKILVSLLIIVYFSLFLLTLSNERWSDGDEVSYLLFTSSLLKDGDLVINNNHENKDYFAHHSNEESPHSYKGRNDFLRPLHGILVPIIMTPAYGLSLVSQKIFGFQSNRAFMFFPRLTMLMLHVIFSLILINFLKNLGFSKNISMLGVILFLIQLPIVIYSQAIYSDLLSGYFIMTGIFGVLLFLKHYNYWWLVLSGTFFGLSIFLHSKLIVLTTLLIFSSLIYVYYIFSKDTEYITKYWFKSGYFRKVIYILLGIWFFFLTLNISMKFYWFGSFNFDGRKPESTKLFLSLFKNPLRIIFNKELSDKLWIILLVLGFIILFFTLSFKIKRYKSFFLLTLLFIILAALAYPFHGWMAQWLDIEIGMFWNAPVFIFLFPGLFIWFKKHRPSFLLIAPAILVYMLLKARYGWYAGFCPPGRYLLVIVPALLPGICWILHAGTKIKWVRWLIVVFTIMGLVLSSLIPFVGRMGLPYGDGYNIYWRTILKFLRLETMEPVISLNFLEPRKYYYYAGLILFTILFILGFYLHKRLLIIEKKSIKK